MFECVPLMAGHRLLQWLSETSCSHLLGDVLFAVQKKSVTCRRCDMSCCVVAVS
jgi:hypothetical protein